MPPRRSKPPSRDAIILALRECRGNISAVAERFGVNRQSVYNWLEADEVIAAAAVEARDAVLDLAESKMAAAIEGGQWRAIEFALRTIGRHRGYVERTETEHQGRVPLEVVLDLSEDATPNPDPPDPAAAPVPGE